MTSGALAIVLAVTLAGCGGVDVPGSLGLGRIALPPDQDSQPIDEQPPAFVVPRLSDDAMERAVQAGLARSDDETWRMIQGCLTPGRSQIEEMLEQRQGQRRPGAQPDPAQFTFRSASLDPRLGRARVLKQQGLLDASYVLLVDVLCEYTDASSKSTVLAEMVSNREEAGDLETAVWFVEGWLRADEATLSSSQSITRQQRRRAVQGRLGALMGGGLSAEMARTMERQAREMRARMLLPAATSYARLGDRRPGPGQARRGAGDDGIEPAPAAGGRRTPATCTTCWPRRRCGSAICRPLNALGPKETGGVTGPAPIPRSPRSPSCTPSSATTTRPGAWPRPRWPKPPAGRWSLVPARGADPSDRMGADLERAGNRLAAAAAVETAETALVEVAVARRRRRGGAAPSRGVRRRARAALARPAGPDDGDAALLQQHGGFASALRLGQCPAAGDRLQGASATGVALRTGARAGRPAARGRGVAAGRGRHHREPARSHSFRGPRGLLRSPHQPLRRAGRQPARAAADRRHRHAAGGVPRPVPGRGRLPLRGGGAGAPAERADRAGVRRRRRARPAARRPGARAHAADRRGGRAAPRRALRRLGGLRGLPELRGDAAPEPSPTTRR